jgi:hypothetical protein
MITSAIGSRRTINRSRVRYDHNQKFLTTFLQYAITQRDRVLQELSFCSCYSMYRYCLSKQGDPFIPSRGSSKLPRLASRSYMLPSIALYPPSHQAHAALSQLQLPQNGIIIAFHHSFLSPFPSNLLFPIFLPLSPSQIFSTSNILLFLREIKPNDSAARNSQSLP